jgi:hypothetical protein
LIIIALSSPFPSSPSIFSTFATIAFVFGITIVDFLKVYSYSKVDEEASNVLDGV